MPTKAAYLLVVPGFADWEPAHAVAELRRHGGYRVEVAVAQAGILRGRRHTSNGAAHLAQKVPGYNGAAEYVDEPAVRDRGLITASGLADVEFAAELFNELGVLRESDRAMWTRLFREGRIPQMSKP